jgi:hypothetical protein
MEYRINTCFPEFVIEEQFFGGKARNMCIYYLQAIEKISTRKLTVT